MRQAHVGGGSCVMIAILSAICWLPCDERTRKHQRITTRDPIHPQLVTPLYEVVRFFLSSSLRHLEHVLGAVYRTIDRYQVPALLQALSYRTGIFDYLIAPFHFEQKCRKLGHHIALIVECYKNDSATCAQRLRTAEARQEHGHVHSSRQE
ncbi:hypothetical protein EDB87DRAFT_1278535 [Lactarius vividus]|nr:hypothetical protein EDB87DRAFT_1278535 [Lactarius vividus]